jgi:hypothetical protein
MDCVLQLASLVSCIFFGGDYCEMVRRRDELVME